MSRLLILIVAVVGLVWWVLNRSARQRVTRQAAPVPAPKPPAPGPEAIVSCAHCGVHLPLGEAVADGDSGRHYCGEAHRLQGPRRP